MASFPLMAFLMNVSVHVVAPDRQRKKNFPNNLPKVLSTRLLASSEFPSGTLDPPTTIMDRKLLDYHMVFVRRPAKTLHMLASRMSLLVIASEQLVTAIQINDVANNCLLAVLVHRLTSMVM